MKKYHNTRTALAALSANVASLAAMFGIAALVLTEGAGYYISYRMPSGYLTRTETHLNQSDAFSHFKKSLMTNELAATRN
jgi:hypothetical protein